MSPDEFLALASPFAAAWFLVWLTHVSEGTSVAMSSEDGHHRKKQRRPAYHHQGEEAGKQPPQQEIIMWNVSNFFNGFHDRIA
jgi:hypothetical protein